MEHEIKTIADADIYILFREEQTKKFIGAGHHKKPD